MHKMYGLSLFVLLIMSSKSFADSECNKINPNESKESKSKYEACLKNDVKNRFVKEGLGSREDAERAMNPPVDTSTKIFDTLDYDSLARIGRKYSKPDDCSQLSKDKYEACIKEDVKKRFAKEGLGSTEDAERAMNPPVDTSTKIFDTLDFNNLKAAAKLKDLSECTRTVAQEISCPEGTYTFTSNKLGKGVSDINRNIPKNTAESSSNPKFDKSNSIGK